MNPFDQINTSLQPHRDALLNHSVYQTLGDIDEMRIFMNHHVFAVWDFMCLLKTLQNRLTCTNRIWRPVTNREACRFINEIVLCEESDQDRNGNYTSHFDLYRIAMQSAGADTRKIDKFIDLLGEHQTPSAALASLNNPKSVDHFVMETLEVVEKGELCEVAACFAFGREDLLPDLFERIVQKVNDESLGVLNDFQYYLNRHIELDGDEHGPMSKRMVESICGQDPALWQRAEAAATRALEARLILWDGMLAELKDSAVVATATDPVD
ncbi:MAG: DUF3050 domain-containing protein [Pirellulaceae bacterium]|nr:DUF3050 domain-containing protein [Pirellulaceae bacterium]